ncbi:hypothetical protein ACV3K4_08725 [Clostridium perfringens]|uniref:hypothetical protein n=1 Tax=Clostridium perfringens TaxID=1502 RepID=UPI0013E30784|nr:hypothetical protein [Clostridium perfringens]
MDCKDCLLRENRRLIDELIRAKEYIKELELKIKTFEEMNLKECTEDLFDSTVFRFK